MRTKHEKRAPSGGVSRAVVASAVGLASALAATPASAQQTSDVNPPLPNVLLLIDTSGSMERMVDGTLPEGNPVNKCTPGTTTPMNRWATLVSVLTGSIDNFSCAATPRDATFAAEYGANGSHQAGATGVNVPATIAPYDKGYYIPFHRLLSNNCTRGPGTQPATWWDWPTTAFNDHDISGVTVSCTTPWHQATDGLLDTFLLRLRFGLMTFDTLPSPKTGILSGNTADPAGGEAGMWSYFPGWMTNGGPSVTGQLPACLAKDYEVGARNGAAPPWEGRLIPFGPVDPVHTDDMIARNARIQDAIIAMRPYGATPLAGMLADAKYFLLGDDATDPSTVDPATNRNPDFGPKADPYVIGGCRKTYIIVLSDGEPNMDMRGECALVGGHCPYDPPEKIALDMYTNPTTAEQVTTYVVGFGLSKPGGFDCKTLTPTDVASAGQCATATGAKKACCSLAAVAFAGSGGAQPAFFADNLTDLRTALSTVLGNIAKDATARTYPVFATSSNLAGSTGPGTAGFQFLSSFNTTPGATWTGNLERERFVCETTAGVLSAQLQDLDPAQGDDFAANVNTPDALHPRKLFTFLVDATTTGAVNSSNSIRPAIVTDDGLGLTTGVVSSNGPDIANNFVGALAADTKALGIDPVAALPAPCTNALLATTASGCVTALMNWNVGLSNAGLTATRDPAACPAGSTCSMLGSIYHSTPAILGPPHDFLRDESYSQFALTWAKRPTVIFAATTDGQLHAFKVAANDPADTFKVDALGNNELWSFFPPNVLPRLLSAYDTQSVLLDGPLVVKDVIYERTKAAALAGGSSGSLWHSVLVGSGGFAQGAYYYALDVTDPLHPTFLWQLSNDKDGNPLFGTTVPQAAVATITLQDGLDVKEVAVAILSGGTAPLQSTPVPPATTPPTCARQQAVWPNLVLTSTASAAFQVRPQVQCWGPSGATNPGASRSITVVRLDTGQVLMNFRGVAADGPAGLSTATNMKLVMLDSPMSGVPVAYPSQVGDVADRAYVGDSDGTLWRIDLSNPDPLQWNVELAWDAYSVSATDTATIGQPIETTPIVSIDSVGNPVVLFSTGDQDVFTSTTPQTRVWSLTEKPKTPTGYQITSNWVVKFTGGKRVTGPISLFNGVAYFATFTPQTSSAAACTNGYGSIWGVDYIQQDPNSTDKPYPLPMYVPDPSGAPTVKIAECANPVQTADATTTTQAAASCATGTPSPDGVVVFGVGVTQTPACADTTTFTDPYLGSHTAISQASGGAFQLVFETGKGGKPTHGAKSNTVTQTLPSPRQTTRIDSWASIVE